MSGLILYGLYGDSTRTTDLTNSQQSRNRSLKSFMIEAIVKGVIRHYVQKTVGTGIRLQATPMNDILQLDESTLKEWSRDVEARFALWSDNKNLPELQRQIVATSKILGECLVILSTPSSNDPLRVIPMDNNIIDSSVTNERQSIFRGVQVDKENHVTAIRIKSDRIYNQNARNLNSSGQNGKINFVLYKKTDLAGEVRGRPIFNGLHEILENFDDFLEAVVRSAKIKSSIIGAVQTESPYADPGQFISRNKAKNELGKTSYEIKENVISKLAPNEKLQLFDTNRDTPNIQDFLVTVCDLVGMATGIPSSSLMMKFRSNYSASRAEILELAETMGTERDRMNAAVNNIIYQQWLRKEILESRIDAPGFFGDDPYRRMAWSHCTWNQRRQESIDTLKEAATYEKLHALGIISKKTIADRYNLNYDAERNLIEAEALLGSINTD